MLEQSAMRSRRLTLDVTEGQYDALIAALGLLSQQEGLSEQRHQTIAKVADKLADAWYGRARGSVRQDSPEPQS